MTVKKLLVNVACALNMLAVFGFFIAVGFFTRGMIDENRTTEIIPASAEVADITLPEEKIRRTVTVDEIMGELDKIEELITYSYRYTSTKGYSNEREISGVVIPFTQNELLIESGGIVKVGYEIGDIDVVVDDEKIYISIPEANVVDNYLIWDSVNCSESNNFFNPIKSDNYFSLIKEIEQDGLKQAEDNGIYEKAEENFKNVTTEFLEEFDEYEVICGQKDTVREI